MDLISYVTPDQEAAIRRLNLSYLFHAREFASDIHGRIALGLERHPDLCQRLRQLTHAQANRVSNCAFPIVGLRLNERVLNSIIEARPTEAEASKSDPTQRYVSKLNMEYLYLARDLATHYVGCMVMGFHGNPALAQLIVRLKNADISRVAPLSVPLVGLRINARLLDMMAEPDRNQNVDAFSFLQTLGEKSIVTSPITHLEGL